MNRPSIFAAATYFARLGFSFYPTRPRSKEPFSELLPLGPMKNGKVGPVWSPFQREAPDADQIRTWFLIAPDANLALVTGAVSNLVIIEFDDLAEVAAFCALCGIESLAQLGTPLVISRRGWHLYFRHPGFEVRGGIGLGDGCEVKGDGLSCTAPPSVHASGHQYRFQITPRDAALQPLPDVVIERLQSNLQQNPKPATYPATIRQLLPDSGSKYGRVALQNATNQLASTTQGRHKAINASSYAIGRVVGAGAIDYATAFCALENAALCTGYAPAECARLVRDGLLAGMKVPRVIENRATQRPSRPRTLDQLRLKGAFA